MSSDRHLDDPAQLTGLSYHARYDRTRPDERRFPGAARKGSEARFMVASCPSVRRFSQSVRQIRNAIQVIIPPTPQSEEVFAGKRANLAAVLNELHGGTGPELLGVAEVEGDKVSGSGMEAQGESA